MRINDRLETALYLARLGFKIIPLHSVLPEGGCTCAKGKDCDSPGKHPRISAWQVKATTDEPIINGWFKHWPNSNYGIVTGGKDGHFALDIDPRHDGEASLRRIEEKFGRLSSTVRLRTGGDGEHILFKMPPFSLGNRTGIKLGIDVRADGGFIVGPKCNHASGKEYDFNPDFHPDRMPIADAPLWLLEIIREKSNPEPLVAVSGQVPHGQRNAFLASEAGKMQRIGLDKGALIAALAEINRTKCSPPLKVAEVEAVANSIGRYGSDESEDTTDATLLARSEWPQPLSENAFHGLVGTIIRMIEPHTESDSAALLFQLLAVMGNVVGRSPHFVVEADRHGTNLFVLLVGVTSKGRKGTSLGRVMKLFESIDPNWHKKCVESGLSSGEGLIWAIRDPADVPTTTGISARGKVTPGDQY
jgi:hypothetical protein